MVENPIPIRKKYSVAKSTNRPPIPINPKRKNELGIGIVPTIVTNVSLAKSVPQSKDRLTVLVLFEIVRHYLKLIRRSARGKPIT